nr:FMRFamide receptor-like [Biomphalaria glabrata]
MSEDSFSDEVYRVGYGYLLNIICCLGVLGNVLVLLVLCKKRGTRAMKTARHYLLMMTVADICVLILAVARYRSYAIFLNDHQLIRHEFCVDPYVQVYVEPLYLIALGSSSYVTVLLTLDRYLAIRFPLFCMKSTVSSAAAYLQTAASVQMIISLTCPLWFSYTVEEFHFLNKTIVAAKRTDFGKNSMYECR